MVLCNGSCCVGRAGGLAISGEHLPADHPQTYRFLILDRDIVSRLPQSVSHR